MKEVAIVTDTYTGHARAYVVGRVPRDVLFNVNYGSRFVLNVMPATMTLGFIIEGILS